MLRNEVRKIKASCNSNKWTLGSWFVSVTDQDDFQM